MINSRNSSISVFPQAASQRNLGNTRQNRILPDAVHATDGFARSPVHHGGIRGGSSDGGRRLEILNQASPSSAHGMEQNGVLASLTDEPFFPREDTLVHQKNHRHTTKISLYTKYE
ncbi:hypothetical protein [Undibacterium sp. TS12]|uniref:hypothetical protein n=1 Tax=Undibacterium sp. TS12 TaxID=2908202 RepID=UPI001F4D178C|nr:hypothetical protein [Undibacterium sp. TS12]MCH8621980.1 hypothetical protein [Undibacterium sp. TS12]